uniref:E3 ubiquitin-protein ligase RNF182-like n=1 Tax=Euleptes europaea TaxID=460621 RepID=UPI00254248D0|nr:E3 ubiquitin-protein ligase RNF182-like [Euleptes europaea]
MALPPTNARLGMRLVECGICYEAYKEASRGRVPKLLWCRHSLCLACLRKLVCQSRAYSFVVCPFCRMVTLVPEQGLQALKDDEALLREMAPQGPEGVDSDEEPMDDKDSSGSPSWSLSNSALSLDVEFNYMTSSPIFTVSSLVPAYPTGLHPGTGNLGRFQLQEIPNTFLVQFPSSSSSQDSQPPPSSVENVRLCFAVTIILLIISIFFSLVFFK